MNYKLLLKVRWTFIDNFHFILTYQLHLILHPMILLKFFFFFLYILIYYNKNSTEHSWEIYATPNARSKINPYQKESRIPAIAGTPTHASKIIIIWSCLSWEAMLNNLFKDIIIFLSKFFFLYKVSTMIWWKLYFTTKCFICYYFVIISLTRLKICWCHKDI